MLHMIYLMAFMTRSLSLSLSRSFILLRMRNVIMLRRGNEKSSAAVYRKYQHCIIIESLSRAAVAASFIAIKTMPESGFNGNKFVHE
jgi:hypothetical protein